MKYIIYTATIAILIAGCNTQTKDKDKHDEHDLSSKAAPKGHNHGDEPCSDEAPQDDKDTDHADEITFTEAQAKACELKVITVKPAPFAQVIKTAGRIQAAQGDELSLIATTNGIVSFASTALVEGAAVRAGQPVVSISARGLSEGDPVRRALINYETALNEYKRAELLLRDTIISPREFARIRLEYRQAQETYQAQTAQTSTGSKAVTSPIGGFVKTRLVNEGQYVTTGQPIAIISQNRRLQLKADVSEKHFRALSTINSAHFRTPYDKTVYKLSDLDGRLLSYGRSSEASSFYIPVTFEFNNIGQMIPGSFVEVFLLASPIDKAISVPMSALIEQQGLYYVILQQDKEVYRKQEVQPAEDNGSEVRIISGLKAGDRVVSQGAMQVKLAAGAATIPQEHQH